MPPGEPGANRHYVRIVRIMHMLSARITYARNMPKEGRRTKEGSRILFVKVKSTIRNR